MANRDDETIRPAQQDDAIGSDEETLRGMDDIGGADDEDDEFDMDDLEDEDDEEEETGGSF
jgi:hypothetical protein